MNKRTQLTIVVLAGLLAASGCATPQERTVQSQNERNWLDAAPEAISAARPVDEPRILPQTHFAAARLFEQQGQIEKAIVQYQRALAVNHDYVEAYNRLGVLQGRIGRHAQAEKALYRAVELRPDHAHLRNNLGYEYALQGRWTDAEAEFNNAISLKPDFARAQVNLGLVLSKQGRFEEALRAFQAALPQADAFYNLGLMFRSQHRYQDAADAFEHVLALNPGFTAATKQLDMLQPKLALANTLEPVANVNDWASVKERRDRERAVAAAGDSPAPLQDDPAPVPDGDGSVAVLTGAETVIEANDVADLAEVEPDPEAVTTSIDSPDNLDAVTPPTVTTEPLIEIDESGMSLAAPTKIDEPVIEEAADTSTTEDEPCIEAVVQWVEPAQIDVDETASPAEPDVIRIEAGPTLTADEAEPVIEEDERCLETIIEWVGSAEDIPTIGTEDEFRAELTGAEIALPQEEDFRDTDQEDPCPETVIEWLGNTEAHTVAEPVEDASKAAAEVISAQAGDMAAPGTVADFVDEPHHEIMAQLTSADVALPVDQVEEVSLDDGPCVEAILDWVVSSDAQTIVTTVVDYAESAAEAVALPTAADTQVVVEEVLSVRYSILDSAPSIEKLLRWLADDVTPIAPLVEGDTTAFLTGAETTLWFDEPVDQIQFDGPLSPIWTAPFAPAWPDLSTDDSVIEMEPCWAE